MDAANPSNDTERVLVAAAFYQEKTGTEKFTSQDINKSLKDLGHGISKMPDAVKPLVKSKPALILQLKKKGTARQGRKEFKVTDAGFRRVTEMTSGQKATE